MSIKSVSQNSPEFLKNLRKALPLTLVRKITDRYVFRNRIKCKLNWIDNFYNHTSITPCRHVEGKKADGKVKVLFCITIAWLWHRTYPWKKKVSNRSGRFNLNTCSGSNLFCSVLFFSRQLSQYYIIFFCSINLHSIFLCSRNFSLCY